MYSNLSSVQEVEDVVKFDGGGFNQTEFLGNFINNNEYSYGFWNYMNNRNTADAYMWKCLSAIGDQIGEAVYTNIRHYVDLVSNIDVCKVQSIRSMMKMFGFDYTVFDDIDKLPVEVMNLMNVVSIHRKYLLNNKILNRAFIEDLSGYVVSGEILSGYEDLSSFYSDSALSGGACAIDCRHIDDRRYFEYVMSLYKTLISGFLTLEFNIDPELSSGTRYYIYPTLLNDSGLNENSNTVDDSFQSDIYAFKRELNINIQYDEQAEVDKIENGYAELDDYSYPYKDLLQMEIDRRAARALSSDIMKSVGSSRLSADESLMLTRNVSRYTYYRKKKVKEYVDFVNSRYLQDNIVNLKSVIYKLDPNFINITSFDYDANGVPEYINVISSDGTDTALDSRMIDQVSRSLAIATMYITKLREKLKLQQRKTYMKGTQNLLLYIINEYLVDYSRHQLYLSSNSTISNPGVTKAFMTLSSHDIDRLEVMEYYDETEYFNQQTDWTSQAANSNAAAQDFWKQYDLTADPGISYALDEIQRFYISAMTMNDVLSSGGDLADFLDAVYSTGAQDSHIDKNTGVFSTRLSAFGKHSREVYPDLIELSSAYTAFKSYVGKDYSYPADLVQNQLTDVIEQHIFKNTSADYFKEISDVYNTYHGSVEGLCSQFSQILEEYNCMVSSDNQFYLTSSDLEYCVNQIGDSRFEYKHDFYIDNPVYQSGVRYLNEKLAKLKNFIYSVDVDVAEKGYNIRNHQLLDMATALKSDINDISANYVNQVVNAIENVIGDSSFVDIQAPYMEDEMRYGYDYLNQRRTTRLEYLTQMLNEIRQQAMTLQSDYNAVESLVATTVASYNDENSFFKLGDSSVGCVSQFRVDDGNANRSDTAPKKGVKQVYVRELGMYYYQTSKGSGKYNIEWKTVNPVYKEDDTLINRINAVIAYMNMPTSYTESSFVYGLQQEGIYSAMVQCRQRYSDLEGDLTAIISRINNLGGNYNKSDYSNLTLKQQISKLIDFLTSFDEKTFENDGILSTAKALIKIVTQLSSQFETKKTMYQDFMKISSQQEYLAGFTSGTKLTASELSRMIKYANQLDAKNKNKIVAQYDALYDKLEHLAADIQQLTDKISTATAEKSAPVGVEELDLASMEEALLADIENKYTAAQVKFEFFKDEIYGYGAVISSYISASMASMDNLGKTVDRRISSLNFFEFDQYKEQKEMFQQYTGLSGISRYPYYPQANVTHPSYQIHPFLWNFVIREKYNVNTITKSFCHVEVEDLEDMNIQSKISQYYGEFGNSISAWLHNTLDHTGYTTRYESSSHYSSFTDAKSEVVGYDGTFYPPAVDMLVSMYDVCMNTLSGCVDLNALKNLMNAALPYDLKCFIQYEDAFDGLGNYIGFKPTDTSGLAIELSGIAGKYLPSDTDYQALVDKYIAAHLDENGVMCEIPAKDVIDYFAENQEETFYGRFYRHLGLQKESAKHKFITAQLEEYFPEIREMTSVKTSKSEVFDVYKYCLDSADNAFFLEKTYGLDNPGFRIRKNACGRLWMRMKEQPFAFPAFTGGHPNIKMDDAQYIHSAIKDMAGLDESAHGTTDEMRYFYDMYITQDKTVLYLVSKIKDADFVQDDEFIQNFENSQIIIIPLNTFSQDTGQLVSRTPYDRSDHYTERIYSGNDIYKKSNLSAVPDVNVDNYAYIGQFSSSANEDSFIYAEKTYFSDRTAKLTGNFKIIPVKLGLVYPNRVKTVRINMSDACSDQIVVRYDGLNAVYAAYLVDQPTTFAVQTDTESGVAVGDNASGRSYLDPRPGQVTSHDIFKQGVKLVKLKFVGTNQLKQEGVGQHYNMNADMSYIPVYPGLSGEARLSSVNGDEYIRVELLGASHDIDGYIANVNISVDPYFDYSRISDDYQFGRVYEDYVRGMDKTLRVFRNPSVNANARGVEFDGEGFVWEISGFTEAGYSPRNLQNLKIAFYNSGTVGKNPYMMCDLSGISDGEWHELDGYQGDPDDRRFAELTLSGIHGTTKNAFVNVTGTYSEDGNCNKIDCNYIENIGGIRVWCDGLTFKVKFVVENLSDMETTFIQEGVLNAVFYDMNDLTMFNYYHFMDVFGAVSMRRSVALMPEDAIRDDVSLIYDRSAYARDGVLSSVRSYYENARGVKEYTSDVDLSAYDSLSDVYILQTWKRLNFMYGEEDVFEFYNGSYYFPTFNTKYPKTPGQGYDSYMKDAFLQNRAKDMFSRNGTFILDLFNPREVADNVGEVDIQKQVDEVECYRVFEEYTEISSDGGIEHLSDSFGKYDAQDARSFKYIHSFEEDGLHAVSASYISGLFDRFGDTQQVDAGLRELSCGAKSSQGEICEDINEKIRFNVDGDTVDLSRLLKLYVNYKKASDGIHLYFNYFNFVDTPFIKIVDNKIYPEIIPSTYLRLAPGESGSISFVSQFKYVVQDDIYGCRNVELAKYSVYNISDDKPKFLLRRQKLVEPGQGSSTYGAAEVGIYLAGLEFDSSAQEQRPEANLTINVVASQNIKPGYTIGVSYMPDLIQIKPGQLFRGFSVDESNKDSGYIEITATSPNIRQFRIKTQAVKTSSEMAAYKGRYEMLAEIVQPVIGTNGLNAVTTVQAEPLLIS